MNRACFGEQHDAAPISVILSGAKDLTFTPGVNTVYFADNMA